MKKGSTILLISCAWIFENIHRIFNNKPEYPIKPFINSITWCKRFQCVPYGEIDLQWYLKDIGELIFFFVIAYLALVNAKPSVKIIFRGLVFVMSLEILNYFLFFKRSELILCAEGLVILGTIIILLMKWKFSKQ